MQHNLFWRHFIFMLRFFLGLSWRDDCFCFGGKLWLHWFWLSLLLLFHSMLDGLCCDLIDGFFLFTTLLCIFLLLRLLIKFKVLYLLVSFAVNKIVQIVLLLESLVKFFKLFSGDVICCAVFFWFLLLYFFQYLFFQILLLMWCDFGFWL